MEHQINKYASLRTAFLIGSATAEQVAELDRMKNELPEEALEDAEERIAAVMPSICQGARHVIH